MLHADPMGRPRKYDYPENMTFDLSAGAWVVRNPVTGKKKKFREQAAAERAAKAVAAWVQNEKAAKSLEADRPTIAGLVTKWRNDKLEFMPWDDGTRRNVLSRMDRLGRELGARPIATTDCMYLEEWLSGFCKTPDQFNKWRYVMVLLWRFAVSRKLADAVEPEKIEVRSTSKKLAVNRKARAQLDVAGFWDVHEHAEPWLRLAMEQSLVTLQARQEVCSMRHADYRDGFLFVIRDKVSAQSDMAFIRIRVTAQLEELRRRSLLLDNSASPYIIHRQPERRRREWTEGKPHWTYVNPQYLTKAFEEARDKVERYAAMPPKTRPTFHEIRGLGSRLYLAKGMPQAAIQALMTHAHKRTTQIYLEKGAGALTDGDYQAVEATMQLSDVK